MHYVVLTVTSSECLKLPQSMRIVKKEIFTYICVGFTNCNITDLFPHIYIQISLSNLNMPVVFVYIKL